MRRGSPAAGHGDRRLGLPLRPLLGPGRDPLLPPLTPVLSILRFMNPSPITELAGETSPSAMAPSRLELLLRPPFFSLSPDSFLAVPF